MEPHMKISGPFKAPPMAGSKFSGLRIFPLTVSVTSPPSRTAPPNSQIAARRHAHFSLIDPAPTDVANALATSLAP
eukprot:CAMPEP_0184682498 /NCGR_PEP_ID=MMETSP0312-20130426/7436_1 /TAXON_ID=31354 /ORGANISM="Compsopogon coeruleus, Strain SAG 36.94" /LENGTH=75 /DNA_ID=CAMNT_0027134197 /DNA_START=34 /DNA_END=257 /DNA_ORIENTATION=+